MVKSRSSLAAAAPTMKTIADKAGVSTMTVSRALRNDPLLKADTIRRIHRIADQLGYRPDPRIAELMSRLRHKRSHREHDTIAHVRLVDSRHTEALSNSGKRLIRGASNAADEAGYRFEEFVWKIDQCSASRMAAILYARGIRGAILRNEVDEPDLSGFLEHLACVNVGIPVYNPVLHRSGSNLHVSLRLAMQNCLRRGYRRPALYLTDLTNRMTEHIWLCSFIAHQHEHNLLAPELGLIRRQLNRAEFLQWFADAKPDALITCHDEPHRWLQELQPGRPEPVGFVHLDWTPECGPCSGVKQRMDEVGAVAVELVDRQLMHNAFGVPKYPLIALTNGLWNDGDSLRPGADGTDYDNVVS